MSDSKFDNPLQERLDTASEYLMDLVNNPYYVLVDIAQPQADKFGSGHYFSVLVGKFLFPKQAQKYAAKAQAQVNKGWRLKKLDGVEMELVFSIRVIRQFELIERGCGRFFNPHAMPDPRYERYERDAAPTMGTLYRTKADWIVRQALECQYSINTGVAMRHLDEPVVKVEIVGSPAKTGHQFIVGFSSLGSANRYAEELRQAATELGGEVTFAKSHELRHLNLTQLRQVILTNFGR